MDQFKYKSIRLPNKATLTSKRTDAQIYKVRQNK